MAIGWEGLLHEQRAFLDTFWEDANIEIDGDAELQQAVRFALFQTVQAGARGERRLIPAKGLTGPGYDGHTFWDTRRSHSHCSCSLTRDAGRSRAPCAGRTARSSWPASAHGRWAFGAPRSRGGRSTARSARATGRRARPRSTSTRRSPTPSSATCCSSRTRRSRAKRGGAARRDRAVVALARPPRRGWSVPDRRRHRAGRVQRDRRQQRPHERARRRGLSE